MSGDADDDTGLIDFYPYRARFKTYERLEPEGRDRQSILDELAVMAHEEDRIADRGRVSGSIYPGGPDHYATLAQAFRRFSHAHYAPGLVDALELLSGRALEHGIGLHVDGCLGGFILPWGERLGLELPRFDFRVTGVTSISADTHKYGYALKGTSVLLYRNSDLRRYQYFNFTDWPGGIYFSPGLSGSRSGGIVAATWAAMVGLGERGYLEVAKGIFETAATIRRGVDAIPELEVIGNPTFLVAFRARDLNIYHVNDHLIAKGWRLNPLQLPAALHFCVPRPNTAPGIAEAFVSDLRDAVEYARHPARAEPNTGALYGLGGTPEGVDCPGGR